MKALGRGRAPASPSPGVKASRSDAGLKPRSDKAKQSPGFPALVWFSSSTNFRNFPDLLATAGRYSQVMSGRRTLARSPEGSSTELFPAVAPYNPTMCVHMPCWPAAENCKPPQAGKSPFPQQFARSRQCLGLAVPACAPARRPVPPAAAVQPALGDRRWHGDLAPAQGDMWRGQLAAGVCREGESQISLWFFPRLYPEPCRDVDAVVGALLIGAGQKGGLAWEKRVGSCCGVAGKCLQFQAPHPKARRRSCGSPPAANRMEKSFLVGQGHKGMKSCCCELLFYLPAHCIKKEHLETTAPVYPHLFYPLFQIRKKTRAFLPLFAFPVSLIWVIA